MSALNCVITIYRDHDLHTKRNDVRAGRSLWVQMLHKSANVGHGLSPAIRTTHFGHSKSKKLSQLEYILHLFLKITISAYYNYLQVSHFLVKLEPVFLLLPPWQVKPNWAAPTVGPTPASNRRRHTSSTIGIFWIRPHQDHHINLTKRTYIQLVCVGQQARRGSDDLRVIWHNSNTYYPHTIGCSKTD